MRGGGSEVGEGFSGLLGQRDPRVAACWGSDSGYLAEPRRGCRSRRPRGTSDRDEQEPGGFGAEETSLPAGEKSFPRLFKTHFKAIRVKCNTREIVMREYTHTHTHMT